jgi:hypothetical protein
MQAWQTPEQAGLLADVQLGGPTPPTAVAWCPVNGLLAIGDRQQHASLARVHLISPHCPENRVTLAVPLQGGQAAGYDTAAHMLSVQALPSTVHAAALVHRS